MTEIVDLYLGMGCFWGAEKRMWQIPGVAATAVGYQGGATANPSYRQVCTGRTGHAEVVRVSYDPTVVPTLEILRVFWENHDPTQGNRQGNDVGTQYRSAAFWTTPEQAQLLERTRVAYDAVLRSQGLDPITTEIEAVERDGVVLRPFWLAEEYHQKYLAKNPHGYNCSATTGVALPDIRATA